MEIVLFTFLAAAGAAFVLYPLLPWGRAAVSRMPRFEGAETRERLLAEKTAIYDNLKDLEFEYETGKLSERDYAELRQAYRVRALDVLERIGESATSPAGEDACRSCGTRFEAEDLFCGICGEARSEVPPAAVP